MKNDYTKQFKELGATYRRLRLERHLVQEDVMEYNFSVRHYQQLEAGRPHSLATLFRLAEMFGVKPEELLAETTHTASAQQAQRPYRIPRQPGRKKRPAG